MLKSLGKMVLDRNQVILELNASINFAVKLYFHTLHNFHFYVPTKTQSLPLHELNELKTTLKQGKECFPFHLSTVPWVALLKKNEFRPKVVFQLQKLKQLKPSAWLFATFCLLLILQFPFKSCSNSNINRKDQVKDHHFNNNF